MNSELTNPERTSILLVADDVLVRNYLNAALTGEGFLILSAANGDEAHQLLSAFSDRTPLLFACLPDPAGVELTHMLFDHYPEMRSLIASGASRQILAEWAGSAVGQRHPSAPPGIVEAIERARALPAAHYAVINMK